jgi:hypothetical protein
MIIDMHTHILAPEMARQREYYVKHDACFAELYTNPKSKLATCEELVESMNQAGVDMAAVLNIGWASHRFCVQSNDYILEAAVRYPGRLTPFCSIQPTAGYAAVVELQRCASLGARGLGEVRPDIQDFDLLDQKVVDPIAAIAIEHNLIFLTHSSEPVGHKYPGKGTITPQILYEFVRRYPQLKVICAHWGGGLPFYALMPEVAETLKNAYFDTAATSLLYRPLIFQTVRTILGSGRILFGSDYPLISQTKAVRDIQSQNMEAAEAEAILGRNADRLLFPSDAGQTGSK